MWFHLLFIFVLNEKMQKSLTNLNYKINLFFSHIQFNNISFKPSIKPVSPSIFLKSSCELAFSTLFFSPFSSSFFSPSSSPLPYPLPSSLSSRIKRHLNAKYTNNELPCDSNGITRRVNGVCERDRQREKRESGRERGREQDYRLNPWSFASLAETFQ